MARINLFIFGMGYTGKALADLAVNAGLSVVIVSRQKNTTPPNGAMLIDFNAADEFLAAATHLVVTAAPDEHGDPVISRWSDAIKQSPASWLGYVSSTGVYGNRNGGWVSETTQPQPSSTRAKRRVAAEADWCQIGRDRAVDIFRLAGIYGPGRSAIDDLRQGRARRISKPGHLFGRIHRDDIAGAILAAICQVVRPGVRVLNLCDDEPAPQDEVVAEAARLLEREPPASVPFVEIAADMSSIALSFWRDNRKVRSVETQRLLDRAWLYPTYREGLKAIISQTYDRPLN